MPRVKRGTTATKKRRAVLKHTKGFRWGRKNKERLAKDALLHAWSHAFSGRKQKKRDFRRLWQVQINAALRARDNKFSTFMHDCKEHNIELDRKVLARIAQHHPKTFDAIVAESTK